MCKFEGLVCYITKYQAESVQDFPGARLHGNFLLREGENNKIKSFRGIQLCSCSIAGVESERRSQGIGGRSVGKVRAWITVISRGLAWEKEVEGQ